MVKARCIQRFRNKNGAVYGYRIQDMNGQTMDVTPGQVRESILNNTIEYTNLIMKKDGKIIQVMEK